MLISVREAFEKLSKGQVIAVPTDTVYGLAADMNSLISVEEIFALKKRPNDKPLIILFSQLSQIASLVAEYPPGFHDLISNFWPGALTLILPINTDKILPSIRSGLSTTGFRIPKHPLLLQLLDQFGPIVAPSANLSGKLSATSADHVEQDFGIDFPVLDGGPCTKGVESTILLYRDGLWHISRQGALTSQELSDVLGYDPEILKESPASLQVTKYVPNARLNLSREPYDGSIKTVLGFAHRDYPGADRLILLGSLDQPELIAQKLYNTLRDIDKEGISSVWVDMNFPQTGLLAAIAQRLEEASRK